MVFFYNLAFLLFGLAYLPIFLVKIRQADSPHRLVRERLGIFPTSWRQKLLGKQIVWVHAVSVGEVMAVQKLLIKLTECFTGYHFVLTTVTPTGQRIARQLEGEKISVCYFPFDLTFAVKRFMNVLKPKCLLLVETEIWPNLLTEAAKARIPIGILNARLSAKSLMRYQAFLSFFKPIFKQLDFVLAQAPEDAARFASLGVDPSRVEVCGNMKFDDVPRLSEGNGTSMTLRDEWGFGREDWILVAGSTHSGEEDILASVFGDLLPQYPSLKLLLAPRHIERCPQLKHQLEKKGFQVRLATDASFGRNAQVLLLNRLGVLKHLYALADAVFMGGSLVRRGGQNPIEPAYVKRAVVHGPFVFNFETIYRKLDQEGGALLIRDQDQLAFAWKRFLEDTRERSQIGENAFKIVSNLQGATKRHFEWLSKFLRSQSPMERINDAEFRTKLFSSAR